MLISFRYKLCIKNIRLVFYHSTRSFQVLCRRICLYHFCTKCDQCGQKFWEQKLLDRSICISVECTYIGRHSQGGALKKRYGIRHLIRRFSKKTKENDRTHTNPSLQRPLINLIMVVLFCTVSKEFKKKC